MSLDFVSIRAQHSLAEIVARTGLFVPPGVTDYKVCCPMPDHDDRNPSMMLHLRTDRFHCFGCGAHGDVIQWVESVYRVSVGEAIGMIESAAAFPAIVTRSVVESSDQRNIGTRLRCEVPDLERTSIKRVKAVLKEAWYYYSHGQLHDEGHRYLQRRRIFVDALEAEVSDPVVGHTPYGVPDRLLIHLRGHGFTDDEVVDAGLAKRNGRGIIDTFRDRVMMPVKDCDGDVVGFVGRYVGQRPGAPKYLNCTKTVAYDKSINLYRPSRPVLGPTARIIICEGTIDALAIAVVAASAGRSTEFAPVAGSGLAISDAQWGAIVDIHAGTIVLCADGDIPGREANLQWSHALAKRGRGGLVAPWPEGDDPASFLGANGEVGLGSITRSSTLVHISN
ncbi:CHC2 zinc finger domain-containing protein [Ferrimicrobium sp.]|uniref:CHC2 zinc finger domain-containing protein n=1 Tax=Ferrimicrobium sp. TaxID=2926050 RepID=UPI00263300CA|nr:CHC2 zinc finger domain-containing protein [Ferrimicrobium sp.]